jgi:hypothetical protein
MDLNKFDQYIKDQENKNVDEANDEKKAQMYREGAYSLNSGFREFSQYYMKAMGMLQQGKSVMNPKYKKLRDSISTAYERMDDSISKHMEMLNKDAEEMAKKMKK